MWPWPQLSEEHTEEMINGSDLISLPVPDPFLTLLTQSAKVARQPVPGGCAGSGSGTRGLSGHQKITLDIFHSNGFSLGYVVLVAVMASCRDGLMNRFSEKKTEVEECEAIHQRARNIRKDRHTESNSSFWKLITQLRMSRDTLVTVKKKNEIKVKKNPTSLNIAEV